ncbi:MAG TPA: hypothetical protein VH079_04030 [Terriglobales bacterium]|jgi:hypothetical protein|nr:hypothetical protein [Terriglobales bacterium]
MRVPLLWCTNSRLMLAVATAAILALPACSVNVKKGDNGDDKKVDINTPLGGIHVNNDADVRDTGLPVYPGARQKKKDSDDEKSANVDISSFGFSLKVVAVEYESDDDSAKLIAFYQDKLKKFGNVVECHTDGHDFSYNHSDARAKPLKCEGDGTGKNVELKVGTEDNQRVVSIEPKDKGVSFSLVYVHAKGKEGSI